MTGKMDYVQKVRTDYSISQLDLARFLGVKRSSIAMGEQGRRSIIKAAVIVKLDMLIDTYAAVEREYEPSEVPPPSTQEISEMRGQLQREVRILQEKRYKEEHKLATLTQEYTRAKKAIRALEKMQENETLFPKKSLGREWIAFQIRNQNQLLGKIPYLHIIQSKVRIASMNEEFRQLNLLLMDV